MRSYIVKEAGSHYSAIIVGEIQGPGGSYYTNYAKPHNKLLSLLGLFNSRINYYYLQQYMIKTV
jgi:hypothetical protein